MLWGLCLAAMAAVVTAGDRMDKIVVDHTYYNMQLYQRNEEGMYDTHYVDVSSGNGGKN